MGEHREWSDSELLKIVRDYRAEAGACTLGDIVKATGLSKTAVAYRVNKLRRAGKLVTSSTVGSLRCADERPMRELADGRLVEMKARQSRS